MKLKKKTHIVVLLVPIPLFRETHVKIGAEDGKVWAVRISCTGQSWMEVIEGDLGKKSIMLRRTALKGEGHMIKCKIPVDRWHLAYHFLIKQSLPGVSPVRYPIFSVTA